MREIYLDNSATTRPLDEVREIVSRMMEFDYGNPSSMHQKGVDAEAAVRTAKEQIARALGFELRMKPYDREILFTSCGTESDNLAIIGTAMAYKRSGMHIITTPVEHPAVLQTMEFLKEQGFRVTYLPVDTYGRVSVQDVREALCEDTILVSIMAVNNEVGAMMPIAEIGAMLKKVRPDVIFHVDAVQGFTKMDLLPKKMGIDLMSISGHKIHGPKGIAVLYVDDRVKLKPILFGGGQQQGLRSGTENVPGIAGIGLAAKLLSETKQEDVARLYELKKYFVEGLREIPGVKVHGIPTDAQEDADIAATAPHIVSVGFSGLSKAEVLLHALEERGIYVSAGSACASNKPAVSATLKAMGIQKEYLEATLRFSFSVQTTKEDLKDTLEALRTLYPLLSRFSRR